MDQQPTFQTPPTQYMPSSSPSKKASLGLIIGLIVLILVIGGGAAYYFLVYAKKSTNNNTNTVTNVNTVNINNANKNSNTNLNANTLVNLNTSSTNTSANSNSSVNVNSQANNNQQLNTNVASNSNTAVNQNINSISKPSDKLDADTDGLSDTKEYWYGTDRTKIDTDGDGFNDLVEIKKFFSPVDAGRLTINQMINYCKRLFDFGNNTYTSEDQVTHTISSDTITAICNGAAELYQPILASLVSTNGVIGSNTPTTNQEVIDSKCQNVLAGKQDVGSVCDFTMMTVFSGFGNPE